MPSYPGRSASKWLALCAALLVSAQVLAQSSDRLTIDLKNASLERFIGDVQRQSDYSFFYKDSETRPISDGFKKNNVNYWVFRDLCSIILHS